MTQAISNNDITILANYNFHQARPTLLGIKSQGNQEQLVQMPKTALTCWNLFLRWIGFGPLANIDTSLSKISAYISKQDISSLKTNDNDTSQQAKAYDTLCELAMRHIKQNRKRVMSPTYSERRDLNTESLWRHVGVREVWTDIGMLSIPKPKHCTMEMIAEWIIYRVVEKQGFTRRIEFSLENSDKTVRSAPYDHILQEGDLEKISFSVNYQEKKRLVV